MYRANTRSLLSRCIKSPSWKLWVATLRIDGVTLIQQNSQKCNPKFVNSLVSKPCAGEAMTWVDAVGITPARLDTTVGNATSPAPETTVVMTELALNGIEATAGTPGIPGSWDWILAETAAAAIAAAAGNVFGATDEWLGGVIARPTRKNCPPRSKRFIEAIASFADCWTSYSMKPKPLCLPVIVSGVRVQVFTVPNASNTLQDDEKEIKYSRGNSQT